MSRERGLLRAPGRQRADSTHVLAAVRALNPVDVVGETMRHAPGYLAVVAPDWLREQCQPAWIERYSRPVEQARLPKGQAARLAWATMVGCDG